MAARRKSFDDWTAQDLRDTFDIEQLPTLPLLAEWLSIVHKPNAKKAEFMEET